MTTPHPSTPTAPGFWAGLSSLASGARFVAVTPAIWPHAALPGLLVTALGSVATWAAIARLRPAVAAWIPAASTLARLGAELVGWLAAVAATLVGVLFAFAIAPVLAGPALEGIVAAEERALGAPRRASLGWLREAWCALRAQVVGGAVALPLLALLSVATWLAPPLALVTAPLQFLVTALALSWNLLDYPLTLRGVGVRERAALIGRHRAALLGFAAAFGLLFAVPCFSVLLLPVGVAAATRLVWQMLEAEARGDARAHERTAQL
ncbi:MAG: EI24 domain-containing protein [Sorangiineae bacterium]|nr:EI24 domain-containing protein [Polyangiaceae bacterium]MEB2324632.1 EI24 domain-containing protein [Sorangiineae bacterium]